MPGQKPLCSLVSLRGGGGTAASYVQGGKLTPGRKPLCH